MSDPKEITVVVASFAHDSRPSTRDPAPCAPEGPLGPPVTHQRRQRDHFILQSPEPGVLHYRIPREPVGHFANNRTHPVASYALGSEPRARFDLALQQLGNGVVVPYIPVGEAEVEMGRL